MKRLVLFTSVFFLVAGGTLTADDSEFLLRQWHQWRGPLADGVAPHGDPPIEWSESKNIRWKQAIPGRGSATPIVWGDRIFVATAVPKESGERDEASAGTRRERPAVEATAQNQPPQRGRQGRGGRGGRGGGRGGPGRGGAPAVEHDFTLLCLDRATGEVVWQQVAATEVPHESLHPTNTHASASPTTDGEHLYVSFGSRGIFCYDLDGQQKWSRNLGRMQTRNGFGEGSSPTIWGDTLVVNWDHEGQSFIVALDAKTGETRWQVERDELSTWGTPLVVEHQGRAQVVTNGANRVRSYDLGSGELLWECGGQASNPIASPVTREGLVYCMTGFRGFAVYAIPLSSQGDVTNSSGSGWNRRDTGPYISSPLLYDNLLYVTKDRNAILSILDAETGEPSVSEERLPGMGILYASPVAAAGRVYYVDRDGTALVLKHGASLEVLATNRLDEGIDASPVIVGRRLLLRGQQHLYCIEESP